MKSPATNMSFFISLSFWGYHAANIRTIPANTQIYYFLLAQNYNYLIYLPYKTDAPKQRKPTPPTCILGHLTKNMAKDGQRLALIL